MITPMVREIKKAFPDSFVATLTQPNTSLILKNNPYVDEIITDDLNKNTFWKVVKEIRNLNFDYGLLVLPTERAAYQMFLAGIKNRIGVGRKIYEIITFMKSVSRNKYIPLRNEADYCMDLARAIGVKTNNFQPEIFVTEEEKQWAEKTLTEIGIDAESFKIFIHSGSKNSSPNWSENKYFELIKGILLKYPSKKFSIILTAYEMTDDFLKKIKNINDNRVFNISVSVKNLRDLINIISFADLHISSSTGPLHLADALNKRCIGFNCHRAMSSAGLWGALNKKSVNVEVTKEYCDKHCSDDKEVCDIENGITPEQILSYVEF